jgi:copper chaperone CopZ
MVHQIQVENIKCGGCMNSIKNALIQLPFVEVVTIDKDTETITVNGDVDLSILIEKLNTLGYPEKGNNTPLKKAKSYVSCAIGKMS